MWWGLNLLSSRTVFSKIIGVGARKVLIDKQDFNGRHSIIVPKICPKLHN